MPKPLKRALVGFTSQPVVSLHEEALKKFNHIFQSKSDQQLHTDPAENSKLLGGGGGRGKREREACHSKHKGSPPAEPGAKPGPGSLILWSDGVTKCHFCHNSACLYQQLYKKN